MAEPELNDPQIDASLKQMGGPGMAQRMHTRLLGYASGEARLLKGTPHTGGGYRHRGSVWILSGTNPSRKEPDRIAMGTPLATEQGERARGQPNGAILLALTTAYLQLHAGTVDPADLKIDAFTDAQAAGDRNVARQV
jgi:hypothetical protein